MSDEGPQARPENRFTREVAAKAKRRIRAMRRKPRSIWTGFAFFGLVGWSVVVPTLAGVAIGMWLDRTHPGERSWTLTLLVAGLVLGCVNVWRWVEKEHRAIKSEQENGRHD